MQRYVIEIEQDTQAGTVSVFLPNTPNPNTGVVSVFEASDVQAANIASANMMLSLQYFGHRPSEHIRKAIQT